MTAIYRGGHTPDLDHRPDAAAETGRIHTPDHHHGPHQEDEEDHQQEAHLEGEEAQATVRIAAIAGVVAGLGLVVETGVVAEAAEEGRLCKAGLRRMLRSREAFWKAKGTSSRPFFMIPVPASMTA